jgi:4-aminobutyrate aminotransferase
VSRRPLLRTAIPGPQSLAILTGGDRALSKSYTIDHALVADRASGCWITDPDGNEFLDMTAGIAVAATGHCHPKVVSAITEQAGRLIHMSGTDFFYPVQAKLASRLAALQPVRGDSARVYFGNSGAEANEAAFKLARYHTGRKTFIAFMDCFHGRTMGALSLTASKVRQREGFGPFLPVVHALYPDPYRLGTRATNLAIDHLEMLFRTILPAEDCAGIFVEPIQGEGGYIVPPDDFLPRLRELADKYGILLIFDEVQSGNGRTGKLWAWEHTGVKPDILTTAKGLASGLPLSATIASEAIMNWKPGSHASTFGGNPVACAAAMATYDLLLDGGLVENAARVGHHMLEGLRSRVGDHPNVGDIRGRGLMLGVELVKDRTTKERAVELRDRVVMRAFEQYGMLLIGAGQNSLRFCPPLVLTEAEADVAVDIFASTLKDLTE